jgi:hypothetical protein
MMNLLKSSASSQEHSLPTKLNTSRGSDLLTPSEIDLLRQSKKSIADYVQRELPVRLKQSSLQNPCNSHERW